MSILEYVKDDVQKICEAISEVLLIDVEVVDDNLLRIAGTGYYKNYIGKNLRDYDSEGAGSHIYQYILDTGENCIIEEPGSHKLCKKCPKSNNCIETAEISIPIKHKNKIIGVIGLVGFNENQKKRILLNIESNLKFIYRMADIIITKINERELSNKERLIRKQLENIIDCIDQGLIAINNTGQVTHFNKMAEKYFEYPADKVIGRPISKFTNASHLLKIDNMDVMELKNVVEHITFLGKEYSIVCSHIPIIENNNVEGAIAIFRDLKEVKKMMIKVPDDYGIISFSNIIGKSSKIQAVKKFASRIANSMSTVLILGESGTGKELFARAIHNSSSRRNSPFIAINCGAIPENLLESELFGYEEGAFTGAVRGGKIGKIEKAEGGTLFLDEIGDLPLHLQVKLLRVLQEKEVQKIGAVEKIPVNIRIIAATNQNLEDKVRDGLFREDLFFRLNVIPLQIPPLRERKEDIPLLAEHFLQKYSRLLNKNVKFIEYKAQQVLNNYEWPGNVRELENVIEYAVNITNNSYISLKDLPEKIKNYEEDNTNRYCLKRIEKEVISKALKEYGNTTEGKRKAAIALGIGIATLYRKIAEYKIDNYHYDK